MMVTRPAPFALEHLVAEGSEKEPPGALHDRPENGRSRSRPDRRSEPSQKVRSRARWDCDQERRRGVVTRRCRPRLAPPPLPASPTSAEGS
jgi:hypothetical protein